MDANILINIPKQPPHHIALDVPAPDALIAPRDVVGEGAAGLPLRVVVAEQRRAGLVGRHGVGQPLDEGAFKAPLRVLHLVKAMDLLIQALVRQLEAIEVDAPQGAGHPCDEMMGVLVLDDGGGQELPGLSAVPDLDQLHWQAPGMEN
ncbi:MAG: hypothetical protein HY717_10935 [Planctomycetes bacterium]|nr:hypothetical protein [Planctomycetota bacterium]